VEAFGETHTPTVSVIILSHRREMVGEAMASVFAQTFTDYQLVVQFCETGWGQKLNDVIRATRGRLVCVLCDDDRLAPTYLAETIAALDGAHADLAYTDTLIFGKFPDRVDVLPAFSLDVLHKKCVPLMTGVVTRALYDAVGGYDPHIPYADWDFWLSCAERGAVGVKVPLPLFHAREHDTNQALSMTQQEHSAAWLTFRIKHGWTPWGSFPKQGFPVAHVQSPETPSCAHV
jgi:glycosyltransferase involved in cell wall biosynthesis